MELTEAELTALALLEWRPIGHDDTGCTAYAGYGAAGYASGLCNKMAKFIRNPIQTRNPPNLLCVRHARMLLEGHEVR